MRKYTIRAATLAVLVLFGTTDARANGNSPIPTVEKFQAALLNVMRDANGLDRQGRFDRLAPAVDQTFHIPVMMRLILGKQWGATAATDQQDLVRAFRRLSVVRLASLFDGYAGETFRVTGSRNGGKGITAIDTVLTKSDGSTVPISYATANFKGDWRIIDVIVDGGISEISVRRSEYRKILRTGGARSLSDVLNQKADRLLAGS